MSSTAAQAFAKAQEQSQALQPVTHYLPFVRKVAQRLARRLPSHVRLEDLIGAGVVGLLEAMERYNPERVQNFETYAEFRVKGAILDELRRRDMMARDARIEAKMVEDVIAKKTSELGREPEEAEIAAALEITVEELRTKLQKLIPVKVLSIEEHGSFDMPEGPDNPFEEVAKREMLTRLQAAITKLNKRHQEVLHLYYQEELTLREIGDVLEVTESRVCQILSEATLRLRALLKVELADEKGKKK